MEKKDEVSTTEIMEFLQEHMMTRTEIEGRFDDVEKKINQTKLDLLDAMDDKLGDLKGDLVILMRKEDQKVDHLIKLLEEKSVITAQDAVSLLNIRPFPQSVG